MLDDIKKTLWATADKLRANMDAAEYKHLVLGLIFIKYISDTFTARTAELAARLRDPDDEYFYGDASDEDIAAELEDLLGKRRLTRFGFLSDGLAAHFGLLQPTNVRNSARMTRGLIAELSIAQRSSGCAALLVLGYPSLQSPTLTDKERSAIEDYTEELGLEAQEFNVRFAAADNDPDACDALMGAL